MRVPPFHSPLRGIALDDVWHDNNECPIGRSIAPSDRRTVLSTLGARCAYCAMLDSPPMPAGSSPDRAAQVPPPDSTHRWGKNKR